MDEDEEVHDSPYTSGTLTTFPDDQATLSSPDESAPTDKTDHASTQVLPLSSTDKWLQRRALLLKKNKAYQERMRQIDQAYEEAIAKQEKMKYERYQLEMARKKELEKDRAMKAHLDELARASDIFGNDLAAKRAVERMQQWKFRQEEAQRHQVCHPYEFLSLTSVYLSL